MTTTAQITDWITAHTGECIDRDGLYGAQAPDLVNAYAADLFGLPHVLGHGKDVSGNLVRSHGWGEITPDQPAEFGDVFSTGPYAGGYGYCGVVIAPRGDELVVFAQNKDGTGQDPASVQLISKADVIGYARPPVEA
ncbi:hypothetical protein M3C66_007760 [Micrococcus luteus]|nr:hypothetical protein [Micrococcus luteus]